MSGASGPGSVTGSPLPKWQLALAVGAPVVLGLGYMYCKSSSKPSSKSNRSKSKNSSKESNTSIADKQISIDIGSPSKTTNEVLVETPLEKAQRFKDEGNRHFRMGKYDEAIAQYTNAIDTCPKENVEELAIFYQNRAAAYEHLQKYSAVKADCTKALELKPKYVKALLRRARALEHCNELETALEDVTAACILEGYNNQMALSMADRVLKQLGKQHAVEYLATKKFVMPSKYIVQNYINSYPRDPVFSMIQNKDNSNVTTGYAKVLDCLREEKYDNIISLCTEQLNSSESDILPHKMEILLLRATFYLLLGQHDAAIEDFGTIIDSDTVSKAVKVNALIKRATIYMLLEHSEKGFADFNMATKIDAECCDIYSHKGQVNLFMDRVDEARNNFKKAVDLNPKFGVAYVYKCSADFHYGLVNEDIELVSEAMVGFEKAIKKFPDCPDSYMIYAQILSQMQQYSKADLYFAKAIEKNPYNSTVYVQRGLSQLKWNGDIEKAVEYINQALKFDSKCEFGYETLATIEVQRGNLEEAIALFDKALELARTNTEITHLFSLRDAAKAQLAVKNRLGSDIISNFQNM
ncbi:translocase of outer membrane 70 [Calliopsis andreniformis]|uniref:translocase of outer membrane 70 n=1 Tax=Calliopsis andreniformis TaxID=337506 RepID=UPI003FCDB5EF